MTKIYRFTCLRALYKGLRADEIYTLILLSLTPPPAGRTGQGGLDGGVSGLTVVVVGDPVVLPPAHASASAPTVSAV